MHAAATVKEGVALPPWPAGVCWPKVGDVKLTANFGGVLQSGVLCLLPSRYSKPQAVKAVLGAAPAHPHFRPVPC